MFRKSLTLAVALAALSAAPPVLAGTPAAPGGIVAAQPPLEVVRVEPVQSGEIVVERLSSGAEGATDRFRLTAHVWLRNKAKKSLTVSAVHVAYPGSGGPGPKNFARDVTIAPGASARVNVPDERTAPIPLPQNLALAFKIEGYAAPYVMKMPLGYFESAAGGYDFPIRREDLPLGTYVAESQNHLGETGHDKSESQNFAVDLVVVRWNGSAWTQKRPGVSEVDSPADLLQWGIPIRAMAPGRVVRCHETGDDNPYGFNDDDVNGIMLEHASGEISYYGHFQQGSIPDALCVAGEGDQPGTVLVGRGQEIGRLGNSGTAGPHLHVQVAAPKNPAKPASAPHYGRPLEWQRIRVRTVPDGWNSAAPCDPATPGMDVVSPGQPRAADVAQLIDPLYQPGHGEIEFHGVASNCLNDLVGQVGASGYAPETYDAYDASGKAFFNLAFRPNGGHGWFSNPWLTGAQFDAAVADAKDDGMRPTFVDSYDTPNGARYVLVASAAPGPKAKVYRDLTAAEHQARVEAWPDADYRPMNVAVRRSASGLRWTALWVQSGGAGFALKSVIPSAEYQPFVDSEIAVVLLRRGAQRLGVDEQRPRPVGRGGQRDGIGRPDRRVGYRVGRDALEQVVARQHQPLADEHRVGRAVPGPLVHAPGPSPGHQLVVRGEHVVDRHLGDEAAVGPADPSERLDGPCAHPVAAHERDGVGVVGVHARLQVPEVGGQLRRAGDGRPGASLQLRREPDMVVVLMGQHEQLEVLDRDPQLREPGLEPRLRLLHARPGVDQGEGRAPQQPHVHVADLERRGQRDAVDVAGQHAAHTSRARARACRRRRPLESRACCERSRTRSSTGASRRGAGATTPAGTRRRPGARAASARSRLARTRSRSR